MMYLLTYSEEGDSGNGPTTYRQRKTFRDEGDLLEYLRGIQKSQARHKSKARDSWPRHGWIHNMRLYKLEAADLDSYMEQTQDAYDEETAAQDAKRERDEARWKEQRRKQFEELRGEFEE